MEHYAELDARNVPPDWSQDCGIARRCKLFLGAELGRAWWYWTLPVRLAAMERRREFAAANLQAESYLEREHNAWWAALGVGHATSGITANVLPLLLPRSILARVPRASGWCPEAASAISTSGSRSRSALCG